MKFKGWTLTAKLVATGTTFLGLALASIGLTLWVTWKLEGGAAAVNEAGRLRMQTYQMALAITSPAQAERERAAVFVRTFDNSLALLVAGDASRPLAVPWSNASRSAFAQVEREWSTRRDTWTQVAPQPGHIAAEADALVRKVDGFVLAIEQEISRWTAVLHLFQMGLVALSIASAVAVMYAGNVLVLNPVGRLRRGFAAIESGDMTARVEVDSRDEFGELSAGFNEMARTLEQLYGNLEAKVREKTEKLEVKRRRLADLYAVSAFLSKAATLDELGHGFARQLRRIGGADACAVRWCDEAQSRYMLLAADNLPPALAESEACLEAGQCACGPRAPAEAARVISILSEGRVPLAHCSKAGFRTVVSIPVRLHDKVLGEVDLFYRQSTSLPEGERELLDALAAHLASAMEGVRAAALEREAAVAQERSLIARELHDSIAQSLAFMKIQVQLLRQAVQREDPDSVSETLSELDAGVRESYADVRELLMHFRTRTSHEDMEPALRTTLSKFEHQTRMKTRLEMEGHGVPLAADVQVQVLHILQEALSNVRKHARAKEVVVRVSPRPHWRFEVRDDGLGFESAAGAQSEIHVGLRIMRERAERIGATVEIHSRRGHGCSVVVELPRTASAAVAATQETIA